MGKNNLWFSIIKARLSPGFKPKDLNNWAPWLDNSFNSWWVITSPLPAIIMAGLSLYLGPFIPGCMSSPLNNVILGL